MFIFYIGETTTIYYYKIKWNIYIFSKHN